MKVLIGQINTTPGDFGGNIAKILSGLEYIKKTDKVDLAVFPELSICGYLSRDLIFETHYVERNLLALQQIIAYSSNIRDVAIVVGYVDHNKTGVGKPFANMLAVVRNGTIMGTYQKHLLPFYDVFDEGRYYEPGTQLLTLKIAGKKVGFTICEDVWNDKETDDYCYEDNPVESYRKVGIDVMVNISSSPFVQGKPTRRYKMLKNICVDKNDGFDLIYVNQIGGQDDLVFDGHSCVIRKGCGCIHISDPSEDPKVYSHHVIVDMDAPCEFMTSDVNKVDKESQTKILYTMLLQGLYDYVTKSGFKSIVLGSSGGIDSAVVAVLACEAFGPKNVNCIMMPSVYSSDGSVTDAKELHKNLGCNEFMSPIEHEHLAHIIKCSANIEDVVGVDAMNQRQPEWKYKVKVDYNKSADENIQARLRGLYVMYFSNAFGYLALTTGNKTELATGYCTLYGDMNGGFAPISDLYKMQVYDIARYINTKAKKELIPKAIIDKAPSAELAPDQTDEASLLPYPILDVIVKSYVEDYVDTFSDLDTYAYNNRIEYKSPLGPWLLKASAHDDYYRILKLINNNEFKRRQSAPGIKVSRVAFGSGRRLPIVKKMRMP